MLGIFAAIGAAFSWTCASFLWREQAKTIPAIQLNFLKNLIALIIFFPILFSLDWLSNIKEISILFLSGFIGISIGDSLYINALKRLGTRKTLSIEALSPILANILGAFLISETPSIKAWIGAFIVTISLVGITSQRDNHLKEVVIMKRDNKCGVIFALLSVLCAVLAAILSRLVLTNSDLSPFQSTEIRILGGLFFLIPLAIRNFHYIFYKLSIDNKLKIFSATLLGTNIGILLQQTVFQMLPIGIGWTLLSISPVTSLIFSKAEGEKINSQSITLAITTLSGVAIALI